MDVRWLFNGRCKAFAELLRAYVRSEHLNFTGGLAAAKPIPAGATAESENRKEPT
jgi:hypothetical protein